MRNTYFNVFVIALAIFLSVFTYSSLSPEIAIQWNNGEVTNTASKFLGVITIPAVMIFIYVILSLLFKTSEKKTNPNNLSKRISIILILLSLLSVHIVVLASGLGYVMNMGIIGGLIVGIATMVLSNIMPQAKSNFVFGLRTPWTLSDEKVWAISNRFTGKILFFAGFLIFISVLIIPQHHLIFTVSLLLLVAVIGTIQSFLVYKQVVNESA